MQLIEPARAAATVPGAAPVGFPDSTSPTSANSTRYHGRRRLVQAVSFALAILVPASGLFRIDPGAGALVVLDRQIWFSDFFLVAGLWIMLASGLVMLYSIAGTVFCGWVCPQNILAEWGNFVTRKFLGRRAKVAMDGSAPLVAALLFLCPRHRMVVRDLALRSPARRIAALYLLRFRADHSARRGLDPPLLVPLRVRVPGLAAQLPHPRNSARALRCQPRGQLQQVQLLRELLLHRDRSAQDRGL